MEKSVKMTLIIAIAIIIVVGIFSFGINNLVNANSNTVQAQGYSTIKVNPDLVTVYFNIETNGTSASEAKNANSLIVDKLVGEMLKLGFSREDVQTQSLNIYEDQRWENERMKSYGFKASHQIKLELDTSSTSLISDVIDAGVDSGAMLGWINFELSTKKQNEYKAQALKEAGQDAKTKAEAIAEGLGERVGSLVSVSTSDFNYSPWNIYSAKEGGMVADATEAKLAVTNIQPGTQEVSAQITAVYKLR
ncbi:DUF541 domain-containing protein [Candidatus Pacearchaeota archaeon]|nr:DUF541 domain-containing protein [Candidatus Pacearchaeota archaeon]